MSKIDDYRKVRAEADEALTRYHAWCITSDDNPTGYFLRQEMVKLTKSGPFLLLLEEHLDRLVAKARDDAKVEAAEFVKELAE